ncbi:MAG: hypothetical protein Q9161_000601 [Pseudevernia consocians]
MPNGFPAFRFDPTTAPRYLIKTAKTPSDTVSLSTDSSQQSTETAKTSNYQDPTQRALAIENRSVVNERTDPPKKSHSKPKGKFLKLLG